MVKYVVAFSILWLIGYPILGPIGAAVYAAIVLIVMRWID